MVLNPTWTQFLPVTLPLHCCLRCPFCLHLSAFKVEKQQPCGEKG